jgi:Na+/melibiose symporter-like transporter
MMGLLGVVITAPMFFLSLYLQQVLGRSALRTGLSMLPLAAVLMAGVAVSKRLLPVLGTRWLIIAGALVSAAGLAWLSALPASSGYVAHILAPGLVLGAGMSMLLLPVTHAATVASTAAGHSGLPAGPGLLHGYRLALLVTAGLAALLAAVATRVKPARTDS